MIKKAVIFWFCFLLVSVFAGAEEISPGLKPIHILNRLSYGPRPGDIDYVKKIGVNAYIREQMYPSSLSETASLNERLEKLDTLGLSPVDLFLRYGPPAIKDKKGDPAALKLARQSAKRVMSEASEARLYRALESSHQLEEVMVDFWYNHFNIFAGKGLDGIWAGTFERDAIRPHVFGKFRDLLGATTRHPAMLFYLDNWKNTAPGSPGVRKQMQGLNENYARELMELHTLGVRGGYTQEDVITLARIMTGWGFRKPGKRRNMDGEMFYFDPKRHDFSQKIFLGQPLTATGVAEGDEALDILASHPSTAKHIAFKLAQTFVSDNPPSTLVDKLSKRFLETDGDIRSVLETLFKSSEFWDKASYDAKFKTPYRYILSALRAVGRPVDNIRAVYGVIRQLGMPLYGCQTPDGYKDTQDTWLNADGMVRRVNIATAIASGKLKAYEEETTPLDLDSLEQNLDGTLSEETLKKIESLPAKLRAAMILGSPDFMRR